MRMVLEGYCPQAQEAHTTPRGSNGGQPCCLTGASSQAVERDRGHFLAGRKAIAAAVVGLVPLIAGRRCQVQALSSWKGRIFAPLCKSHFLFTHTYTNAGFDMMILHCRAKIASAARTTRTTMASLLQLQRSNRTYRYPRLWVLGAFFSHRRRG